MVNYDLDKEKEADITLPANITGEFIWKDRIIKLQCGRNKIKLE
jgi:hypothetical protein